MLHTHLYTVDRRLISNRCKDLQNQFSRKLTKWAQKRVGEEEKRSIEKEWSKKRIGLNGFTAGQKINCFFTFWARRVSRWYNTAGDISPLMPATRAFTSISSSHTSHFVKTVVVVVSFVLRVELAYVLTLSTPYTSLSAVVVFWLIVAIYY